MAGVDSLLKVLVDNGGDELIVTLGAAPELLQHGKPMRFFFPEVGAQMHSHLLGDLLDEGQRAKLAAKGSCAFLYEPEGLVGFEVDLRGSDARRAHFRRADLDDAPAERAPVAPAAVAPAAVAPVEESPVEPVTAGALAQLLEHAAELGASDLHLATGEPAVVRIDGRLSPLGQAPQDPRALVAHLLDDEAEAELVRAGSLDRAVQTSSGMRYRANLYRCEQGLAAAFRILRREAPALGSLGLPVALEWLVDFSHGLVIVCGPTGSGKSTTLAALAREALRRRRGLLLTLEDPIEYAFAATPGTIVRQREIGRHVADFPSGLRAALREDPDLLLVGEMRDPESIQLALTAAETGHLVLASLHSRSAPSAVERIVDSYPPERQQQIRVQLADALRAVVSQRLLPRASGRGRVPAVEVLKVTHGVAHRIREGKTAQLVSSMQTGASEGMVTLERCVEQLVRSGRVTAEVARLAVGTAPA